MIPFCWLVGGGDQERTKEVELTFTAIRSSGGALGAENEIIMQSSQILPKKTCECNFIPKINNSYHLERSAVKGQE